MAVVSDDYIKQLRDQIADLEYQNGCLLAENSLLHNAINDYARIGMEFVRAWNDMKEESQ